MVVSGFGGFSFFFANTWTFHFPALVYGVAAPLYAFFGAPDGFAVHDDVDGVGCVLRLWFVSRRGMRRLVMVTFPALSI